MLLERGSLLNNRYRIIEILGQGGMGSVYRATDENLGMDVAVKDNLFTTDDYARQFRREAQILANLRHKNLPRVTDHFVIEGQGQYLVMDYIEGEDLRQRMDREGAITDEEVVYIGAAVCDALTYLETLKPPIVHRDIKPGNIKITPTGSIYLVDFGLAKVVEGSQATTTGARAMTPGYSPPEQYGTARTDQRSDIFSLGATLYAALTGSIPEDALSRAMDQCDLTPIRSFNSKTSKRLAQVIEKSLSVRPDDRFQNAEEFKQALLNALTPSKRRQTNFVVEPPPDVDERPLALEPDPAAPAAISPPRRISPPQNRSPLPVSTVLEEPVSRRTWPPARGWLSGNCLLNLILGVVLLTVSGFFFTRIEPELAGSALAWFAGPSQTPTSRPDPVETDPVVNTGAGISNLYTPAVKNATPTPTLSPTPTPTRTLQPTRTLAPTDTPTLSPTPMGGGGGQLAFASDQTGVNQIYIINMDGTGLTQVTNMETGACQPDWSADGLRLVFISSCDSNHDVYPNSGLFLINVDGTGLTPIPGAGGSDYDPAWSPDGKRIAFTSTRVNERPQIYIYNLEDGSFTSLSTKYARDFQPKWSADGQKIIYINDSTKGQEVWMMDADGSNQRRVTDNGYYKLYPSLSPDGKLVLFTQMVATRGIPRLMVAPLDANPSSDYPLSPDRIPMREADWSPDGYWIAFEGWNAGANHDIYLIASNGAARTQLTNLSRTEFDAAWKPNP